MAALLYLTGAAFIGIGLVRVTLGRYLSRAEQVLWGFVIGWSGVTGLTYLGARYAGHLTPPLIWIVTGATWLGVLALWGKPLRALVAKPRIRLPGNWEKQNIVLLALLCFFALLFTPLFDRHMLKPDQDGGLSSGRGPAQYDLAFHVAVSTSFAYGDNFPPTYTPLPPAGLLYPPLPDFLTAVLLVLGLDLHSALVLTAVPLALALTGIFYCFALRLSHAIFVEDEKAESRGLWTAAIATLLYFFNGGLGFVDFFRDWRGSGKGILEFLSALDTNYTHSPAHRLFWPNLITDMLLPQRNALFGLALGFIIFSCFLRVFRERPDAEGRWRGWRLFVAAGVLAAALPWFHPHSYFAVGFVSIVLAAWRPARLWLFFWLPALILALPMFWTLVGHVSAPGFLRFLPGWRGHDEQNWIGFWLRNTGVVTVLALPAWVAAGRVVRQFYLSFVLLLTGALLVVLSPNDYDNLKLMYYWLAINSVLVAAFLVRFGQGLVWRPVSVALVLLCTLSGALAVVYEWQGSSRVFDRAGLAAAEFVKTQTSPHTLFLTAPSLHQPVLSLTGRAVVRGPTSWLWSHGYPFAEREADVRSIYAGGDNAVELLRYYGVDYIYVGEDETRDLKVNRDFFDGTFPVVYRSSDVSIYDARSITKNERQRTAYPAREYGSRVERDPGQWLAGFPEVAYRLYCDQKLVSGSRPGYADFRSNLVALGRGLYVGNPGWLGVVEENERDLAKKWLGEPTAKARDASMTDAEYVSALFRNAGLACGGECQALTTALTDGRETRDSVLRKVASEMRRQRRQYNDAYVLIHYFAWFGRDPNAAPDHDLTGYEFWCRQLDSTRDYLGITRAFLESAEYRERRIE